MIPPLPETQLRIPFQGRTPRSKHAGWTGARSQVHCHGEKTSALLQVLANGGPMSRNELWVVLKWTSISSVCSILGGCLDRGQVESAGEFETVQWPDGSFTKRERFRVKR